MDYFEVVPGHWSGFCELRSVDVKAQLHLVDNALGRSLEEQWKTPELLTVGSGRMPDFCWLEDSYMLPLFSSAAVNAVGGMLTECGELLPTLIADEAYFVFHSRIVKDFIDWDLAVVERNEHGDVQEFEAYAFNASMLREFDLFRILYEFKSPYSYVASLASPELFTSRRFKELWEASGLNNADFEVLPNAF